MDSEGEGHGKQTGLTKKQELNNHIVLMRKAVRQAKVHVVRKLTREVAKLKDRKGTEEIKQKCQRKAERLHQEIISIKTLEEDQVSISALRNTSTLVDVLQNTQSTPEDRARSRLIHHTAVQNLVKKYRDSNPHWRLQIPVLLEKNPQKLKKAQKKQEEKLARRRKIAGERDQATGGLSDSDSQTPAPEVETEKKENVPTEEPVTSEPIVEAEKKNLKQTKGKKLKEVEVPPAEEKPKPKTKVDEILSAVTLRKQVSEEKLNKTKGTVKVQLLKSLDDLEFDTKVELEESKSEEKHTVKPKSSFFLGGVDIEEESKGDSRESEGEEEHTNRANDRAKHFGKGNFGKFSQNKFHSFESNRNFRDKPPRSKPPPRYSERPAPAKYDRPPRATQFQKPPPPAPAEKLHPSWEAKKRQSIGIPSFQGKKIKFDD